MYIPLSKEDYSCYIFTYDDGFYVVSVAGVNNSDPTDNSSPVFADGANITITMIKEGDTSTSTIKVDQDGNPTEMRASLSGSMGFFSDGFDFD